MKIKILFLMLLLSHGLQARYYAIKNEDQFLDEINRYEFVIACFLHNPSSSKDFDKQFKKDVQALQDTVKSTSQTDPYKKLLKDEVGFLVIDMNKDATQPLIKKYEIESDGEMPQFLLFKNGKVITNMSGELAKLDGFISKADLMEFISDYFGNDFDDILAKKSDEQEQERQMQLARYQSYDVARYPYGGYAPYNPWGSPGPYIYSGYAQFYPYGYSFNGFAFFIP
ncbi:MAG: thioredoxin family protein [Candidatus Dependentiae bacterium]|nr:thioredoxin family protein [Candidatus Dependentiae bacterium]